MKSWKNPEIKELKISLTSQGGSNKQNPDKNWTDVETGTAWTSYSSGK